MLTAARANIGTPFRHQGRMPGRHLDCLGNVVASLRAAGLPVVDYLGYRRISSDRVRLLRELERHLGPRRPCGDIRDGDVLVFSIDEPRSVHLAIADGRGMIHVEHGRAVEWGKLSPRWRQRLVAVFGFRE